MPRITLSAMERCILAGILLGATFLHPYLWPLIIGGVSLWFSTLAEIKTYRHAFFYGWALGFVKMAFALLWIFSVEAMVWGADVSPILFFTFLTLLWLILSLVIGLGMGVTNILYVYLRNRWGNAVSYAAFPPLLLIGEIVGAFLFSILAFGAGSGINISFTFGQIGYVLINHEVLRLPAVLGGVYTLTLFCAFLGMCVSLLWQKHRKRIAVLIYMGIVLSAPFGFRGVPFHDGEPLRVALAETAVNSYRVQTESDRSTQRDTLESIVRQASLVKANYTVLPEDARFFEKEVTGANRTGVVIDSSRTVDNEGNTVLQAKVVGEGNVSFFEKRHLVPLGEYIPYLYQLFAGPRTEHIEDMIYVPGQEKNGPVLFCSESMVPFSSWIEPVTRKRFIAHPVSHAWFKETDILEYELLLMVKANALRHRAYVGVAANSGEAYLINPVGDSVRPKEIYQYSSGRLLIFDI